MNTKPNNHDEEEINLSHLASSITHFFHRLISGVFNSIRLFIKHKWILSILIIGGFATGILIEKLKTSYDHYILVQPNFGSTDYLYAKVDEINAKIKSNDTLFLKSIGIKNPKELFKIKIKPIIDVYKFVNMSDHNFELIKLMSEDSDIKKIMEDTPTSKNYSFHLIHLYTKEKTNQSMLIKPILAYLNDSDFFKQLQKEHVINQHIKIKANEVLISQIDGYLNGLAVGTPGSSAGDKMVFYTEKTQLNDVIGTKNNLVQEQGNNRVELISLNKIIKDHHISLNLEASSRLISALKFILPFLFIGLFIFIKNFLRFNKKEVLKSLNN